MKYRMKQSLSITALIGGCLAATWPAFNAHAAGATEIVYSPVFCQTFGGSLWIHSSGQISNKHWAETMRVFCPLTHEAKHDHSGKLQIAVTQANRDKKVRCRAFFNHWHANVFESNAWDGADQLGIQETTITLPGHKFLGGSHMIECEIPPKTNELRFDGESRIGSYKAGVDK